MSGSNEGNARRSLAGTDSSSSRCICESTLFCSLENRDDSLAMNGRKVLKKIFERRGPFEVVKAVLHGNASVGEAKRSAHDFRVAADEGRIRGFLQQGQFIRLATGQSMGGWVNPAD